MNKIKVVDIFAGPGGLGEGFASFSPPGTGGERPFQIACSAEKDPAAVRTLRLRTFYRLCREAGDIPESYYEYLRDPACPPYDMHTEHLWEEADQETRPLELGTSAGTKRLREMLESKLGRDDQWVLIGGPPCQAYSLVGRSRNRGNKGYRPEKDKRHFLYRQYLKILAEFRPAAFVMENVKGILSSRVGNELIFPQILKDLSEPNGQQGARNPVRYRIHSLVTDEAYFPGDDPDGIDANNFIVRTEDYGIPQARHRVILIGIRDDGVQTPKPRILRRASQPVPVEWAIRSLPDVRSGLSKGDNGSQKWLDAIQDAIRQASRSGLSVTDARRMRSALSRACHLAHNWDRGGRFIRQYRIPLGRTPGEKRLLRQLQSFALEGTANHQSRGHMPMDLARYLFASTFAEDHGRSPRSSEFPKSLAPDHKNWTSGYFADRFRVQVTGQPGNTVTSHISKDGHYYIHPDPTQCRSLTVREAARIQTFPDDYFFEGNRTEQYIQTGNAVPPLLAKKIANIVYKSIT
ncbi:DNA cytosine methyltransferase [Natronospira bacteriovora]|uniref:DNA (cytosine-5-)-methyltransferase n=1 Tax=Natronospira bacteriovora TaxID=3069753 RepID=A0ABU0W3R0_9GAMM|nr:DNA (cytosine-5-)-methyltransferase [Natronospira sp. AB-CW4]MDQ2068652.1 DNA (cytosine-5-)-methyltransferase [Natronospira sp. AB-CW4]